MKKHLTHYLVIKGSCFYNGAREMGIKLAAIDQELQSEYSGIRLRLVI